MKVKQDLECAGIRESTDTEQGVITTQVMAIPLEEVTLEKRVSRDSK